MPEQAYLKLEGFQVGVVVTTEARWPYGEELCRASYSTIEDQFMVRSRTGKTILCDTITGASGLMLLFAEWQGYKFNAEKLDGYLEAVRSRWEYLANPNNQVYSWDKGATE